MYTTFQTLTIRDYGPFKDEHTLKLDTPGLVFIKGRNEVEPRLESNGAGKSRLLNALVWCLYGKTSDDLGNTDIRSWDSKAQAYTAVNLSQITGDLNQPSIIERTAGPNSLRINGKVCVQEDVDRLLGMSLNVFRQAVFLGQGQPLFHDRDNADKLRFLSDVLGLDRWDSYSDKAKDLATKLDRECYRLSGQLSDGEVRCKELATQVDRQKQVAAEWEAELTGKRKALEKDANKTTKELERTIKNYSSVTLTLERFNLELTEVDRDFEALRAKESQAALAIATAKQARLAAQRDLDSTSAQLRALKDGRQCPTCGAAISKQSTYLENVKRINAKVQEYTKALHEISVEDLIEKHEALIVKMTNYKSSKIIAQDKVNTYQQEVQLAFYNKTELKVKLQSIRKERDALESGENPHRGRLTELRKALKQAIADDAAVAKQHAETLAKYEVTKYWIKGFKDVRLFILEDVLQELQFTTNNMLTAVGLVGWQCTYDVERETKAGTTQRGLITTVTCPTHSANTKWKAWSGGEGQRLRLAGALALSQVLLARAGVECNLEILDEPSKGLSTAGISDLCEFLADRAASLNKSIYLVDHHAIESSNFSRTLTIVKTKAGSKIT